MITTLEKPQASHRDKNNTYSMWVQILINEYGVQIEEQCHMELKAKANFKAEV